MSAIIDMLDHHDGDHHRWDSMVDFSTPARAEYGDLMQRAEAAEDRAVQLQAERDAALNMLAEIRAETILPDGTRLSDAVEKVMNERDELTQRLETLQEMYRADHDQRVRLEVRLQEAYNEIDYERRNIDSAHQQGDEWNAETPFGQALDGIGDEVEP